MATQKRFIAKNGLDNNAQTITNVATPVNTTDAVTKAYADLKPDLSSTTPAALGVATVGTGTTAARSDHVHASPTTVSGNAGTATSIAGQTTNGVLYQSGSGVTTSTAASTAAGQVLTTTTLGGVPSWQPVTATTATTSTNLANGSVGTIPYQSAANTTAMLAVGTAGQVLQSNAAAAPSWTTLTLESLPDAWVKKSCACATTAALTINTAQTTIDGVTLTATSRVLVKDQLIAYQNGIYTGLTTTTWVRATDADTISKLAGASVNIDAGTVNGGKVFDTDLKTTDVLGITAISFYSFLDSSNLSLVVPAALGATAVVGTSTTVARSDHVHALPSLATLGAQAAGSYVTGVTGTAPVSSSGGTAPVISMAAATASVNGYMTSTYASKLDGIASGAIALSSAITGYESGAGTVAATDSILGAIQKLNGNTPIASSTTPAALGTAAVGTGTTFARADHVHAAPTTVSGNAGTVTTVTAANLAGAVAPSTSGNVLTSNGTSWISSTPAASGSGFTNIQVYTTTTTWVIPAGVTKCKVTVVAGGGGGAGGNSSAGGGAGGAGGTAIKYVTGLVPAGTVVCTVGTGGTAGTSVSAGGAGVASSFGLNCSATGGAGGSNTTTMGGLGGLGASGSINIYGASGHQCSRDTNGCSYSIAGGNGGSTPYGSGGIGGQGITIVTPSAGSAGRGYGAGGGGGGSGTTGDSAGGAGSAGIIIIEY